MVGRENIRIRLPLYCVAGALLLIVSSCGTKHIAEIPVLDVKKSYPSKNIVLQDIADVEYIPLETKKGFLIAEYFYPQYMDGDILITNNRTEIMTFDRRTGKALTSFSRYGRGPGEYLSIGLIAVDVEKNEMFVRPSSLSSNYTPIIVYDLLGKHLRTLEFRGIGLPPFFHNYNAEYLFCYNTNIEEPTPYKLLSKTDTIIAYLPIEFTDRNSMAVTKSDERGTISYFRDGGLISKTSEGYVISEAGLDTMYHWNTRTGELSPVMTRIPSFNSMEFPIGAFIIGQSSEYIFLNTIERKFDFETREGFKTVTLVYDKKGDQFYESTIINGDYIDNESIPISSPILNLISVPAGQFVLGLEAYKLVELHKAGKLKGKLAEVASTLNEDDNPVLMIATFK